MSKSPKNSRKVKANVRAQTLAAALSAVNGSRQASYAGPEENFLRIARLWNAHLVNAGIISEVQERAIGVQDVAIMMGLVKDARLAFNPEHLDSWIDKAGYAACGAEVSNAAE